MKNKILSVLIISIMMIILLSSCAPGGGSNSPDNPAGFFKGIWHGWIAPISLIWGIFNQAIRVYEPFNTGWWYDFGFYMAIIGGFGSLSLIRRESRKKDKI